MISKKQKKQDLVLYITKIVFCHRYIIIMSIDLIGCFYA